MMFLIDLVTDCYILVVDGFDDGVSDGNSDGLDDAVLEGRMDELFKDLKMVPLIEWKELNDLLMGYLTVSLIESEELMDFLWIV